MRKMTKSQSERLENLKRELFSATDAIFSVTSRNDVPFMTCYAMAPMQLRAEHARAKDEVESFCRQMVSEGRGYFDQFGHFQKYNGHGSKHKES